MVMHVQELAYDEYEPVVVARTLAERPGMLLLDSAARGKHGRYSFVAADPFALLTGKDGRTQLRFGEREREQRADPWLIMQSLWEQHRAPHVEGLPPFQGGLAGYWGYGLARHLEQLPFPRLDDLELPDLWLGAYDWTIAWDHVERRCRLLSTGLPAEPREREAYARRRAAEVMQWLATPSRRPSEPHQESGEAPPATIPRNLLPEWPGITSTFTAEAYEGMVERALEHIYAGDIYQVNLSQRLEAPLRRRPWELYIALRQRNPADFAAYLNCGDHAILSASPERFLRLDGREVETRPIKGTIARSLDPIEDRLRAEALQVSKKDRAENLMIVDLLRNDLGRVCETGSIHVPELWSIEGLPTVYHLVSTVRGRLRASLHAPDLLRAAFPGGSITGAPKIRAMEIIADLEPTARGPYCGSIGYLSWGGQMDTNIVIRTLVVKDGRVYWQAGGGIVAESSPAGEYAESLAKARALSETILATW